MGNIIPIKWDKEASSHFILISDKIVLKLKWIRRAKEEPFIFIKGAVNQKDITVLNRYASNSGVPNFI